MKTAITLALAIALIGLAAMAQTDPVAGTWRFKGKVQSFGFTLTCKFTRAGDTLVRADADGKNPKVTPFITGFKDDATEAFWGRPAYLLQMPDGSLLLSDEQLGAIYRISYAKP